jgi:hypothetical protein
MFSRFVRVRNAFIFLVLFVLNAVLLGQLDRPLEDLANGAPKPDLRFGYSTAELDQIFSAYGEEGRRLYGWNLLADTPFPIFGGLAGVLFVLAAFSDSPWRRLLAAVPLTFLVTDLIENALLFGLAQAYPPLSEPVAAVASLITQIKRTAFYGTVALMVISALWLMIKNLSHRRSEARQN